MNEFEERITIEAPPDDVFAALADIGSIDRWNPGVERSVQTSTGPVEVGAARRCELGGKRFLDEEVVAFEPPHRLIMRITDSNLPIERADIRFMLAPAGDATVVTVSPQYALKFGPLGKVLDALVVRAQYRKGMRALLAGLKAHVEG